MKVIYMLLRFASFIPYLFISIDIYALFFFYIFLCLITSSLATYSILDLSGNMYYRTFVILCLLNYPYCFMETLWIAIKIRSFSFLVCLISLDMHVLYDQYFTRLLLLSPLPYSCFLVSTNLQINYHNYLNLISKDLYLRLKGMLPYGSFQISNLTLGFRLSF